MEAAELGYRRRFNPNYSFDATAFVHRYRDGISMVTGSLDLSTVFTQGYAQQFVTTVNGRHTQIRGLEFAAFRSRRPGDCSRVYTWQYAVAGGLGHLVGALASGTRIRVPRHLFSCVPQHNLGNSQQLDFWVSSKEAGSRPSRSQAGQSGYPLCLELIATSELSVVGQNLLHERVLRYPRTTCPLRW